MPRQVLGRDLADVADAERVDEAAERRVLAFLDRRRPRSRRTSPPCARAPRASPRRACRGRPACAPGPRRPAGRRACRRGPRCPSRGARRNAAAPACAAPGRTARRCSAPPASPSSAHHRRAAHAGTWSASRTSSTWRAALASPRAPPRGSRRPRGARPRCRRCQTSLRRDLVLVVQRGVDDRDAADEHRLEPRHRRERAGAPDLDLDVLAARWWPPRRETCARPPSAARARRSRGASARRRRSPCRPRRRCRKAAPSRLARPCRGRTASRPSTPLHGAPVAS